VGLSGRVQPRAFHIAPHASEAAQPIDVTNAGVETAPVIDQEKDGVSACQAFGLFHCIRLVKNPAAAAQYN